MILRFTIGWRQGGVYTRNSEQQNQQLGGGGEINETKE